MAYAVVATVVGLAVGLLLRRGAGSDLVRAEAAEWLGDALLSGLVLVGFLGAVVLVARGRADLAGYVDPAMVVVGSVAFLRIPIRLVAGGIREVLSMAPPAPVLDLLRDAVEQVKDRHGFDDAVLRAAKVGSRVDIEVVYLVGELSGRLTVADCDQVRRELHETLGTLGYERSLTVWFTRDGRPA